MSFLFASLIILAPLYVWRFSISFFGISLPTNFLMIANFLVIAVAVVMMFRQGISSGETKEKVKKVFADLGKSLSVVIGLFFAASLISLFAFGFNMEKLAQWLVLYAQPIAIFFLIRFFDPEGKWNERFKIAAYIFVGLAGALALVQYFTLMYLPPVWWGNANEPKRAIAFFAHANAFGLFMTPLLVWLIPDVIQKLRDRANLIFVGLWVLGAAGMFLSLSRGAWLGLFVAAAVYALVTANKKVILGFGLAVLILAGVIAAVPNLRYRVMLPFQGEKSTVARFSLWDTAGKMIKDSPVFGKGVNGFSDNWDKYNTDPGLEHYNFPHNIFLNFWVDLGLLGLVSMMGILTLSVARGFVQRRNGKLAFGMLLFIIAMVVHGLIDIPYLKNDLALIFWIVLALGL